MPPIPSIRISKYRDSRFFAIYLDDELLAVTVYKKGAAAIRDTLMGLCNPNPGTEEAGADPNVE